MVAATTIVAMPEHLSMATIQDLRFSGFAAAAFNQMALRDGLLQVRRASFPAAELTLAQLSVLGEVALAEELPGGASVVLRPEPEMLIHLSAARAHGKIAVAG